MGELDCSGKRLPYYYKVETSASAMMIRSLMTDTNSSYTVFSYSRRLLVLVTHFFSGHLYTIIIFIVGHLAHEQGLAQK